MPVRYYVEDLDRVVHVMYIRQTAQGSTGWTCCFEQFTNPRRPQDGVSMMIGVNKAPTCLGCIVREEEWAKLGVIRSGLW